jgi:hypothetical protein
MTRVNKNFHFGLFEIPLPLAGGFLFTLVFGLFYRKEAKNETHFAALLNSTNS